MATWASFQVTTQRPQFHAPETTFSSWEEHFEYIKNWPYMFSHLELMTGDNILLVTYTCITVLFPLHTGDFHCLWAVLVCISGGRRWSDSFTSKECVCQCLGGCDWGVLWKERPPGCCLCICEWIFVYEKTINLPLVIITLQHFQSLLISIWTVWQRADKGWIRTTIQKRLLAIIKIGRYFLKREMHYPGVILECIMPVGGQAKLLM